MNSDGNVSFVRRAAQFTSVGDEQEAFYLRVYGVGQYRYHGADLGILITRGRMQTDDRKLIDRAKLWNAGIKAQFKGVAPAPGGAGAAGRGQVDEDVLIPRKCPRASRGTSVARSRRCGPAGERAVKLSASAIAGSLSPAALARPTFLA